MTAKARTRTTRPRGRSGLAPIDPTEAHQAPKDDPAPIDPAEAVEAVEDDPAPVED